MAIISLKRCRVIAILTICRAIQTKRKRVYIMKIIARQIPPEEQTSPLYIEEFPGNICVYGNKHYKEHLTEDFKNVKGVLENGDLISFLEDEEELNRYYSSEAEVICDYLPPATNRPEYSAREIEELKELVLSFEKHGTDENIIFRDILSIVTEEKLEYATITGDCQGEWQQVIYPGKYKDEWIKLFECEYFNTGSEWELEIFEGDEDTAEPTETGRIYCYNDKMEDFKNQISWATNCPIENIKMLEFDGYKQKNIYKEV